VTEEAKGGDIDDPKTAKSLVAFFAPFASRPDSIIIATPFA
jgi:hypothetical protein